MVSIGQVELNGLNELVIDGEKVTAAGVVNDVRSQDGAAVALVTEAGCYCYEMDGEYWAIDSNSGADSIDFERYYIRLLGYTPYYN